MNDETHINGAVSALVMLAAIAGTWTVYNDYKDEQLATEYGEIQSSMEQTASVLVSLRIAKEEAMANASSTVEVSEASE